MKRKTKPSNWAPRSERSLRKTAAHELGHVIAHITTERYFFSVWIAGVNEWQDKQYESKPIAGCVSSYRHGGMKFDGKRVKHVEQDLDVEAYLVMLLGGVAAEEVFSGQERPRSIIEISRNYRLWESETNSYGDFQMAQKWVKQGAENGYFYAKEVWGVLQHYYAKAFWAVRSHKEFLLTAMPLLIKKGTMYNTDLLTLWHNFYQIEPEKKEAKTTALLDIKDNIHQSEETLMQFTELETFFCTTFPRGKSSANSRTTNYKPTSTAKVSAATTSSLTSAGDDMTFEG
jgi:hypothetical protein